MKQIHQLNDNWLPCLSCLARGAPISKSVFTPEYQTFLTLLRQARLDSHLSQRELNRRLNQHSNFVSSCEMGDRVLAYTEVRAWVKALELDWVEFTRTVDAALAELESSAVIDAPVLPETEQSPQTPTTKSP